MLVLAMGAAIAMMGGANNLNNGDRCDPFPPPVVLALSVVTPGDVQLDTAHAVLSVRVPLLTPPLRAFIGGRGLRWESGIMTNGAVSGDEEERRVALPPLQHATRYDVALVYADPTPEGCEAHPQLVGTFVTP